MSGSKNVCDEIRSLFPEVAECEDEVEGGEPGQVRLEAPGSGSVDVRVDEEDAEDCAETGRCAPVAVSVLASLDGGGQRRRS